MRLTFHWSPLILVATLVAFPTVVLAAPAGNPPPFCAAVKVPPASCQAEKALPCTGACPVDLSNHPDAWQAYWNNCQPQSGGGDFSLAQKQFMCDSNASELHIVYLAATLSYLCCIKDPFDDKKENKNPTANGDKK